MKHKFLLDKRDWNKHLEEICGVKILNILYMPRCRVCKKSDPWMENHFGGKLKIPFFTHGFLNYESL